VCENAAIYQYASPDNADNATFPKSQIIDCIPAFNNMAPSLFLMHDEEHLKVGNDLQQLLKNCSKHGEESDK